MAHELEQLTNGQTAFVTARVPAWHQLGTVTDDCMTAEDVMAKAFLGGWKVRKIDLQGVETTPDGVTIIECPDRRMTVRTNIFTSETEYLGIVGTDYGTVQNEEAAEVLNRLVDESGAHFETAGSLRGGRMVFITMKLPTSMRIAGVDDMDLYLCATTSHDGTSALRVDASPIRVVCYAVSDMSMWIHSAAWLKPGGRCSSRSGGLRLLGWPIRCCRIRGTWMRGWTVTT
jgi:phage/plasmid-like protein (TIGR03299 family)